jgi:hypothetical protein
VVGPQPGVHTRGSRVARHDRLRHSRVLEAANLTSNFDPNLDPNRPQQRPTQADILQEAVAEISRLDGALSNIDELPGSLKSLDV